MIAKITRFKQELQQPQKERSILHGINEMGILRDSREIGLKL